MNDIESLHNAIRSCRKCQADGFAICPPPLADGVAPAPFMLIGQAPGIHCMRAERMYSGPAAKRLIGWLLEAGFTADDIGTTIYMTAITKCFPGRNPGVSKDRPPSPKERANCRPWLDAQIELVRPRVIILFGKMAIDAFLPKMPLEAAIGRVFDTRGITYLPLPHSSGASTWLNDAAHRQLVRNAIERLGEERLKIIGK